MHLNESGARMSGTISDCSRMRNREPFDEEPRLIPAERSLLSLARTGFYLAVARRAGKLR